MEIHQNEYAKNLKNEVVYILDPLVKSGRKGYYCMGCGQEMQARKGEIRKKHFAHDPKDVAQENKCTYSDETYRHYLAKKILSEIKEIKVPNLYKYPPNSIDGKPYLIRESHIIKAFKVHEELAFYENNNGEICWEKKDTLQEDKGDNLLIRPDVSFLMRTIYQFSL